MTLGIPVEPMLAQPSKDIGQVLERLQGKKFTCEYKYDGERTQIHKLADGTVKIFSRNLEDTTPKFPDIINFLPKVCNGQLDPRSLFILTRNRLIIALYRM